MKDKSEIRKELLKLMTAEQRLNAFCKRHGIEDIGDYTKVLEQL